MTDIESRLNSLRTVGIVPTAPSLEQLSHIVEQKRRSRRRIQYALSGTIAAVLIVATVAVTGLAGGPTKTGQRLGIKRHFPVHIQAQLVSSLRAGQLALASAAGPAVGSMGVIGPGQMWLFNGSGLFLTTDDGSTFHTITPPVGGSPIARILSVSFVDASTGWVLANASEQSELSVFKTSDGGTTWSQSPMPPIDSSGFETASMVFLNSQSGYVVVQPYGSGNSTVLHTNDGGMTWQILSQSSPILFMYLIDGQFWGVNRLAAGNTLFDSPDAGKSWATADIPSGDVGPDSTLIPIAGTDTTSHPIIADIRGNVAQGTSNLTLLTTKDGGSTWTVVSTPFHVGPCGADGAACTAIPFAAITDQQWILWLGNYVYSTSDAGEHWSRQLPNFAFAGSTNVPVTTSSQLSNSDPTPALVFLSDMYGWATVTDADGASLLLVTDNGGVQWTAVTPPGGSNTPSKPGLPGIAQPGSIVSGKP